MESDKNSEWYNLLRPYADVYKFSPVIFIVGMRSAGKSALGYYILEQLRLLGYGAQVYGFPPQKYDLLPSWIQPVWNDNLETVPMNTTIVFDEAYMHYLSRNPNAAANKLIGGYVGTSRHRNQPLIYITQIARMVDVNVKSFIDIFAFKQPGLLQEQFERDPVINRLLLKAKDELMAYPDEMRKRYAYVFSDPYEGIVSNGLPSFWSDELSRVYSTDLPEPKFTILRKIPDPEGMLYALQEMTGMSPDGSAGVHEKKLIDVLAKYGRTEDYDAFMTLITYLKHFSIVTYDEKQKTYRITEKEMKKLWARIN